MHSVPKIPGFELLDRLGGGLLTHVFSARDCSTDGVCAVKVLRAEWQDQPTAIKLLQREARAMQKLDARSNYPHVDEDPDTIPVHNPMSSEPKTAPAIFPA